MEIAGVGEGAGRLVPPSGVGFRYRSMQIFACCVLQTVINYSYARGRAQLAEKLKLFLRKKSIVSERKVFLYSLRIYVINYGGENF